MQKPLISVCIPTYNRPVEIQEAIESVIVQLDDETRSLVEIVVSYDPGAENEAEVQKVLQEMVKKYDTVRYFKNEKNMRFSNGLIANEHATGEYLMPLSDDDYLTEFSISYLIEIIKKTNFDFLLHKAVFTPDVHIPIPSTPNTYSVYQWAQEYIKGLANQYSEYKDLISYFSFNSIMVIKASYRNESYNSLDKEIVYHNEFPQEFPPYYDLKDKTIVLADSSFVKGRIINASYYGTTKLVKDFKITMDFIEKQNDLGELSERKKIKKTCVGGWSRTMYLGILLHKLNLDYKKKGIVRWLYFFYKKYLQK